MKRMRERGKILKKNSLFKQVVWLIILMMLNPYAMVFAEASAASPTGSTMTVQSVAFVGGNGTEHNPYQIASAEQLDRIRNAPDKHYVLTAGIDLSSYGEWTPIDVLTGSLDGQGHTISGLTINRSDENDIGLFKFLGESGNPGEIRNLNMENVDVTGQHGVGALVGRVNSGTIDEVQITSGTVRGTQTAVGGLTGRLDEGSISNVSTSVTVTGGDFGIGGVVGRLISGQVTNAEASGDVEGPTDVGGLVGRMEDGTIVDASASGAVTATEDHVGGLVGHIRSGKLENTSASGDVHGEGNHVGGLIGRNSSDGGIEIIRGNASGSVYGKGRYVGGLMGSLYNGTVQHSFATGKVESDGKYVGGLIGIIDNGTVQDSYATGDASSTSSYVGGLIGYVKINGDIRNSYALGDVSSGYLIDRDNHNNGDYAGGLIGRFASGTVQNVYAEGNVNLNWEKQSTAGPAYVGGLIGFLDSGTVRDSYAVGQTAGVVSVGGLIGEMEDGLVERSHSSGKAEYIDFHSITGGFGGLIGTMKNGKIFDSYSLSKVAGHHAGGLIGRMGNGEVRNSYAEGKVWVPTITSSGGLIGKLFDGLVVDNYAAVGPVWGEYGSSVGGLVGLWLGGTIQDNYALVEEIELDNRSHGLNRGYIGKLIGQVGSGISDTDKAITNNSNRVLHRMNMIIASPGKNSGYHGVDVDQEVEVAESNPTDANIEAAFDSVMQIPYEPVRLELLERLYRLSPLLFELILPEPEETWYVNDQISVTGTVYGNDKVGVNVTATLDGVEKSVTLSDVPTTMPDATNIELSWDVTGDGIADGIYPSLTFELESEDGLWSASQTWNQTIAVDTQPPELTVYVQKQDGSELLDGISYEPVTVTSEVSDAMSPIDAHRFKINDGDWKTYGDPFVLDQTGTYELTFEAVDRAGNITEHSETLTLDIQPHVQIVTAETEQIGNEHDEYTLALKVWDKDADAVTVTAEVYGIQRSVSLLDTPREEPETANVTLTWTGNELAEGVYRDLPITVSSAGDVVSLQWLGAFIVDKQPPGVHLQAVREDGSGYDSGEISAYPVTVTAIVYGELSGVQSQQYRINDGDWQTYTEPITFEQSGTYELDVRVTDKAGNQTDVSMLIQINQNIPVITLLGDNPHRWPLYQPYVDPGYEASSPFYGDLTAEVTVTGEVYINEPGIYERTYTLTDPGGLSAEPQHRTVIVYDPHAIHQLSFDKAVYELQTGDSVQTVVEAVYENGQSQDITLLAQLHSVNEAVASFDAQGQLHAHRAGETTIVALYEGAVAEADVKVVNPTPPEDDQDEDRSDWGTDDRDQSGETDSEAGQEIRYQVDQKIYKTEYLVRNDQGEIRLSLPEPGDHILLDLSREMLEEWAALGETTNLIVMTALGGYEIPVSMLMEGEAEEIRLEWVAFSSVEQEKAAWMVKSKGGEVTGKGVHFRMYSSDGNGEWQELKPFGHYYLHAIGSTGSAQQEFVVSVDIERGEIISVPPFASERRSEAWTYFYHFGNQSYVPVSHMQSFADIQGHWAQEAVERMASAWVVNGYTDQLFRPNQDISRAEFVTLLVKSLGVREATVTTDWTDVDPADWYAPFVQAAVSQGWIDGYPDGSFRPNAVITREQMAVILDRVMQDLPSSPEVNRNVSIGDYDDNSSIGAYARDALERLIQYGLIQGVEENRLAPTKGATRGEALVLILRMIDACLNPMDALELGE